MKNIITGLSIIIALALTGCTSTAGEGTTEDASGTNAPAKKDSAEKPEAKDEKEEPADDGVVAFGESYKWEDGLVVKISQPKPFTPSEYAMAGKAKAYVAFNVKIVNNTGAAFDPSMFSTTMQSGNKEAEEVFDTENGFNGSPMTKLLDGRESTFKIGYGVSNPDDLVLDVSPSFEHQSMLWAS